MALKVPFRLRVVFASLIAALTAEGLSLYAFTLVDNVVHKDLYAYGLQFNIAWANNYWNNSNLFFASTTAALILIGVVVVSVLIFIRNNSSALKLPGYIIPFIVTGLNLLSIYAVTKINGIINNDLYNYGLQPSLNWGLPLQDYFIFIYFVIAVATAISIVLPMIFHRSIQEKAIAERIGMESYVLMAAGVAALVASVLSNYSILAYIGLGLIFFGVLFIFLRTEEYSKKILLTTVAYPEIAAINQIVHGLNFKGKPIYLPPKYFKNSETCRAYIPKLDEDTVPTIERIKLQESHLFVDTLSGMLVTPPGSEIAKLFEKTLSTNFASVNLQFLQQKLPRLIVNDLEIAKSFEIEVKDALIRVKIENSVYSKPRPEKEQPGLAFGSPLGSAIACALAKATGKPVVIDEQQNSPDGKNAIIDYRIMTEEAQTKP